MTHPLLLALAAVPLAGAAVVTLPDHNVQLDHRGGTAAVRYSGNVDVEYRQVGNTAPGGRSSTLSCRWSADLTVHREARHSSGATASRVLTQERALEGRRPGWCEAHRGAVQQEVAARADELQQRVAAMARHDRDNLLAELEHAPNAPRAG